MTKRNQLLINNNFSESFLGLSDENAGKLIKALFNYHLHNKITKNNDVVDFALQCIIPILNSNDDAYDKKCLKNKENAEKRWNANECERIRTNANDANRIEYNRIEYNIKEDSIEENKQDELIGEVNTSPLSPDRVVDSSKPTKRKKSLFIPPSYDNILSYAKERNREDIAKKFYDYFTVGNWVDNKGNKVHNWKQKFITWEGHSEVKTSQPKMSDATKEFFDKFKGEK